MSEKMSLSSYLLHEANSGLLEKKEKQHRYWFGPYPPPHVLIYFKIMKGKGKKSSSFQKTVKENTVREKSKRKLELV